MTSESIDSLIAEGRLAPGPLESMGGLPAGSDALEAILRQCGAAVIDAHHGSELALLPASQVVRANPLIAEVDQTGDFTDEWWVFATYGAGDHVVIELGSRRPGAIFDGQHEIYGLAGDMPQIATDVEDFLKRIHVAGAGESPYWERPGFVPLADAFDE